MKILLIFIFNVAFILVSIAIGYYLSIYLLKRNKNNKKPSLGSIIAAMFVLLSFVLAFIFSLATSNYTTQKLLVLDEANAIGTAVLRTDFLAEPSRSESQKLFKEYVNIRVEGVQNPEKLSQALVDSEILHKQLWSKITDNSNQMVDSELLKLYIESLNQVIDVHSKRVAFGLQYKIPTAVWFIVYFITLQAMLALGYEFGQKGKIAFIGIFLLAFMFSAVISVIADLDQVEHLLLKVNQQPLIELQQKLNLSIE